MKVIENINISKIGFSAELVMTYSMDSISIPDVIRTVWYRVWDLDQSTDRPIFTSGMSSKLPVNLRNNPKTV